VSDYCRPCHAAAVIGTVLVVFLARAHPHRFPAMKIQLACAGLGALLLATAIFGAAGTVRVVGALGSLPGLWPYLR
jgi:hypothetical protein